MKGERKSHQITRRMGILVHEKDLLMIQKIVTDPQTIKPGNEDVLLEIWIVNAGGKVVKNVDARLLHLEGITPAWSGADKKFLGNLLPYEPVECEFFIDVDEEQKSGVYPLRLELTHNLGRSVKEVHTMISPHARFELGKVSYEKAVQGGTVKIHVPITNVGDEKAEAVQVQLKTNNYFTGYKTSYLGQLGPGESDTAIFDLDIDKNAEPDVYLIDAKIYWDEDDDRYTDTEPFSLRVEKSWLRVYLFLIIVALTLILIGATLGRKIKARRELMEEKKIKEEEVRKED